MVELRTKVKYLVPVAITTTDAAAKLKNLQKQKLDINKFSSILQKWIYLHLNLNSVRNTEKLIRLPLGNFDKLVSHIDLHVINLDHPLGMETSVKLYLGSGTDEASGETIKKRRQEKRKF